VVKSSSIYLLLSNEAYVSEGGLFDAEYVCWVCHVSFPLSGWSSCLTALERTSVMMKNPLHDEMVLSVSGDLMR